MTVLVNLVMNSGRMLVAVVWMQGKFSVVVAVCVRALRLKMILTRLPMNLTGVVMMVPVLDVVSLVKWLPMLGLSYGTRGVFDCE